MAEPRIIITREAEGGAIGAGLAVIKGTDTNKQVKLPAAAGDRALGITGHKADAAGDLIPVVVGGIVKAIASAAIAVGDLCDVAATSGKLRATIAANANVIGIALTSAAADGDEFDLLVVHSNF